MMRRIIVCFFLLMANLYSYSQVKTIFLNSKNVITRDTASAAFYAIYGKVTGDSVYTFKKYDFHDILLVTGYYKDESLEVAHGKFNYYSWITADNNNVGFDNNIKGRERFLETSGNFTYGVRDGRWINFYPDGKMAQVMSFSMGILHGPYQSYDEKGKLLIEGLFKSGKKNGPWLTKGGKQEDTYEDDVLVSSLKGKELRDKRAKSNNTN